MSATIRRRLSIKLHPATILIITSKKAINNLVWVRMVAEQPQDAMISAPFVPNVPSLNHPAKRFTLRLKSGLW